MKRNKSCINYLYSQKSYNIKKLSIIVKNLSQKYYMAIFMLYWVFGFKIFQLTTCRYLSGECPRFLYRLGLHKGDSPELQKTKRAHYTYCWQGARGTKETCVGSWLATSGRKSLTGVSSLSTWDARIRTVASKLPRGRMVLRVSRFLVRSFVTIDSFAKF